MSDSQRTEHGLMGTSDAMVWAEEFCRIFKGWTITDVTQDVQGIVDPGGMVGWFANAMFVGERDYRDRCVVEAQMNDDGTITLLGDLPMDVLISRELLEQMIDRHNSSIHP